MPPSQPEQPTPVTPPPVPPAPVAPTPAPVVPPPAPKPPVTQPMADMVMPKGPPPGAAPVPPTHPHEHGSHTAAIVSGALLIGLILGAAAGYYGGQFQTIMEKTATEMQTTQAQTQEQAATDATASTYGEVDTNPLQDVQTNPFE